MFLYQAKKNSVGHPQQSVLHFKMENEIMRQKLLFSESKNDVDDIIDKETFQRPPIQ